MNKLSSLAIMLTFYNESNALSCPQVLQSNDTSDEFITPRGDDEEIDDEESEEEE